MRNAAKILSEGLSALWHRIARYFHLAVIVLFVLAAVELVYKYLASQEEFGFPAIVGLVGLFWVLLAGFVLYANGMDVLDRIVDWFQPECSGSEPGQRKSQSG